MVQPRSTTAPVTAPVKGVRSYCTTAVCKAHSKMQSMSLLGGLGACPPGKF